jgi:hypothetical protein
VITPFSGIDTESVSVDGDVHVGAIGLGRRTEIVLTVFGEDDKPLGVLRGTLDGRLPDNAAALVTTLRTRQSGPFYASYADENRLVLDAAFEGEFTVYNTWEAWEEQRR